MKVSLALSLLLPLLAAAAPTAPENPPFGVMAGRSASPIHLLAMNAAGQKFWLGGETTSYCPLPEGCPAGTSTVFSPGGYGLVSTSGFASSPHLLDTDERIPERHGSRWPAGLR
jgi:hypothetical protein